VVVDELTIPSAGNAPLIVRFAVALRRVGTEAESAPLEPKILKAVRESPEAPPESWCWKPADNSQVPGVNAIDPPDIEFQLFEPELVFVAEVDDNIVNGAVPCGLYNGIGYAQ
jgi:hypothetical protein